MASRPPIYFINLAARTDRRAFMEGQFSALGLKGSRIEAIPTRDLTPEQLALYCNSDAPHPLTPPEAACALSHVRSWQAFLDAPGAPEWGLVLEDDGILAESLPRFLDEFLAVAAEIPSDILQLETRRRAVRVLPPIARLPSGHQLAPFRSARDGGACYLISRRAVSTLLQRDDLFHQPLDLTIFRPFTWPGRAVRSLLVEPALCIQLNQTSNASESARSDLAATRNVVRRAGGRWLERTRLSIINFVDNAIHLPRGLKRRVIAFDGDTTRLR